MINYDLYTEVLKKQLIPATGCTEPISLAYAAAVAKDVLGEMPYKVEAYVSSSIVKNAKSVVVPGTNGLRGIESAIAAGVVVGDANAKLEVLASAPENTGELARNFMEKCSIQVELSPSCYVFDIWIKMYSELHVSQVRITEHHTNVVLKQFDDKVLFEHKDDVSLENGDAVNLKIDEIFEYANTCSLEDVRATIEQQILCNTALSKEGMDGDWGAQIGKTLLHGVANPDVKLRAVAAAAAGSDARMSGCEMPAVINSGSGNQGLTITLPIVEYAKELGTDSETLIRAMVLANLVSIRIKKSIGYLSAYCGAVCAGCGAAAGIAYLYGANKSIIEHTIVNGLAILSGTICDGAKPSCAAKIAMSVEAGLLGLKMSMLGQEFVHGEGIIKKGIENTIREVGTLSKEGMDKTNDVILDIMLKK